MLFINLPTDSVDVVYETCSSTVQNENLRLRLNDITDQIIASENIYQQLATQAELYSILKFELGNDGIVFGEVTRGELNGLYNNQIVNRTKPGRRYYDLIISNAPNGKCPYCGLGQASTLDHFLPKTSYPQYSVTPINLIPACKDCNTGKSAFSATIADEQCLHPYFDHGEFSGHQWLHAEVIQTSPATISFYVNAPDFWDTISKNRINFHFSDFRLAQRFSVEAATEIASLRAYLILLSNPTPELIKDHLRMKATAEFNTQINSWKTAMYQALHTSDWYCAEGYSN